MTRDAFIDFLARCVADGLLTEEGAAELVREYDAGTLGDGWQLPVAPGDSRGMDEAAVTGALLGLLTWLATQRTRVQPMTPAQVTLRVGVQLTGAPTVTIGRNIANADRLITGLQTVYEGQARAMATALVEGRITVAQWQLGMEGAIQSHMIQQMSVGGGSTVLTPRQWADVQRIMGEQNAYLSRFADTIALRQGQGAPLSEAAIASRSELYGGPVRGMAYGELESAMLADGMLTPDFAVYYVSRDDPRVCVACLEAQRRGPYRIGSDHPRPGTICYGRSRCRCNLEYRYEPEVARRLAA